jgi:uncharacterized protein YutE (UPF0331/DUF86 family)
VTVALDDETESRLLDRAEYVEEAVTVLASKQSLAPEDYRSDREQRAIVEREFQTAIEACIDIAGILIAALDEPMPETNADRFVLLIELDVLTEATGSRMRDAAGFRNVLAHRYGNELDHDLVFQHLQTELDVFVSFLREVRAAIDPSQRG